VKTIFTLFFTFPLFRPSTC